MRNIKIGDTPLMAITESDIRQLVIIEGCSPSPLFWNDPIVLKFDNTIFSDTVVLDYMAIRKADNLHSEHYTFFLNTDSFTFYYCRNLTNEVLRRTPEGRRLSIEMLSFLIKQGYNIPL